jgi:hypothetical protein
LYAQFSVLIPKKLYEIYLLNSGKLKIKFGVLEEFGKDYLLRIGNDFFLAKFFRLQNQYSTPIKFINDDMLFSN